MTTASHYTRRAFGPAERSECIRLSVNHDMDWGDGLEIFTFTDGSKLLAEADQAMEIEVAA